jgi:hypothetical protein
MSGCGTPAVSFVFNDWVEGFPAFRSVTAGAAQASFNTATLYCANKLGPVRDVASLTQLLYLLTAHITALNYNPDGSAKASNAPVGRLSDATEGSVSASFQNEYPPGTAQWYQQTTYGAQYWAATAQFRTMQYRGGSGGCRGFGAWQYPGGGNWAG